MASTDGLNARALARIITPGCLKLKRLPIETQQALQLLACLGNCAEFALLEMGSQQSSDEMHARFWEATTLSCNKS
jgi:hypothetical protein